MGLQRKSDEGIIRPVKLKGDPEIGPDAVMVMVPPILEYIVSAHQARLSTFRDGPFYNLYRVRKRGYSIDLAGPFLGAPQAVMGMEKMIALGAERIWVLGWAGSLQKDLRIGDLVIPTGAISEEGTSQHYPIDGEKPVSNETQNRILERAINDAGISMSSGMVWTTDAPYRETPAKVRAYQEKGVLAVEMELAALMSLAIYRSVKIGGVLIISDELFDLKWKRGFSSHELKKNSQIAGDVLLHLIAATQQSLEMTSDEHGR
ncbi:nucleoside phosphorylase [Thermodesulfobacteriota bacterium]